MNKISIISSVIIFLSTYNIESQRFNRNHIILPPTICSTANLADLSDYIQNANPTGNFDGPGVTHNNGIFSFNATTAGIGTQTISYTYVATTGCAPITITASIEVLGNCGLPFISQIYSNEAFGREKDRFIEIKNKSQNDIAAGTYYLAVYNYPNSTSNAPDSFIDIGAMSGLETKVFCR